MRLCHLIVTVSVAISPVNGSRWRYTDSSCNSAGFARGNGQARSDKGGAAMAVNRFVLNNISYHGAGAIGEIPGEIARRGFAKAFVCSDPDLVRFGVTGKVTAKLDEAGIPWELYDQIKPNPTIKNVQDGVAAFKASERRHASWRSAAAPPWTRPRAIGIIVGEPRVRRRASRSRAWRPRRTTPRSPSPSPPRPARRPRSPSTTSSPTSEKKRKFVCVDTNDIPDDRGGRPRYDGHHARRA